MSRQKDKMKRKIFSLAGARTHESDYFRAAHYLGCKPVTYFEFVLPILDGFTAWQNHCIYLQCAQRPISGPGLACGQFAEIENHEEFMLS